MAPRNEQRRLMANFNAYLNAVS